MGARSRCTGVWMICLLALGCDVALALDAAGTVGFLDERLRIPESARFRMPDYIESGVGLSFGRVAGQADYVIE